MKKIMFFLMFLLIMFPNKTNALDKEIVTYDIKAKVSLDRIVDIEETYNFYFTKNITTIDRVLDSKLSIIRKNNTKKIDILISDVNVLNRSYREMIRDGKKIITYNIDGKKDSVEEYKITYKINLGKDTGVGYDELFVNIIDGTFDTNVSNINFTIELPINFNNDVTFLIDGKSANNTVNYSVGNKIISGNLAKQLKPNQTFSLRVELPEGYFIGATDNYNYLIFLTLLIPIIGIIYTIIFWIKYSKGNKIKTTITYEPPYNFDSAEISYLYHGFTKESDIVSLLIQLGNEGYLEFKEYDDGYKLDRPNSFKIIKLKDYEKDNAAQKVIFEKIFKNKDTVEIEDIEYKLFDTLVNAKKTLDNEDNKNKLFYSDVKKVKKIITFIIIASIISVNSYSIYLFTNSYILIPFILLIQILGMYVLFIQQSKKVPKIIIGGSILSICLYIGIRPIMRDFKTLLIYIIGMVLIILTSILAKKIKERTIYGNEKLGEMIGFKKGLLSLTKEQLQEKINENPNYFYDMYPYAYIFDICEEWNKKGSELISSFPNWYHTKEEFSLSNFQKFIKNMIYLTTQAMFKRKLPGMSKINVKYKKDINVKNMENR